MQSVSKTSPHLLASAIHTRRLQASLFHTVLGIISTEARVKNLDPRKRRMNARRNLFDMTRGTRLERGSGLRRSRESFRSDGSDRRLGCSFVIDRRMATEPGTVFWPIPAE